MQGRILSEEEASRLFYSGNNVVFVNCLYTLGRAAKRLKKSDLVRDSSQELFTTQGFYIFRNQLAVGHLGKSDKNSGVRMALVDAKIARKGDFSKPSDILVKWSPAVVVGRSLPEPPTAVFLHGNLGSKKNWGTFTSRLAQEFPTWQFLLVDLRCHGDSASTKKRGPHSVSSTALDVLELVRKLRLTPRVIVGHSFGGKVALSMVDQAAKPLARPVRVSSKRDVVDALVQKGFSKDVAQWVVTNLRPTNSLGSSPSTFPWVFDLKGIAEMYKSYEETNLWQLLALIGSDHCRKIVEDVPRGVHVHADNPD
ncbi:hypothetical protein DVH24_033385 [Malus domestica]|uniref:AB hydrolase-1 domain-containing protein n=1 Tax=Malus domestica TaxID=3750 RepID=A0A498J9M9_MALDO|nr:hypothetical protein DVH24_033385 [Malus domestica]